VSIQLPAGVLMQPQPCLTSIPPFVEPQALFQVFAPNSRANVLLVFFTPGGMVLHETVSPPPLSTPPPPFSIVDGFFLGRLATTRWPSKELGSIWNVISKGIVFFTSTLYCPPATRPSHSQLTNDPRFQCCLIWSQLPPFQQAFRCARSPPIRFYYSTSF